jgi:hypothetical protein
LNPRDDRSITVITEIYSGKMSKWNGVSQSWAYPLQPQAGHRAYVRNHVVPSNPGDKGDSELIWTEPSAGKQSIPTKTQVIYVQYGNRTWSVTTAFVAEQTETGSLQALRESIVNGKLTVVRKTVIDGQTVLELTTRSKDSSKGSAETWWVTTPPLGCRSGRSASMVGSGSRWTTGSCRPHPRISRN